MRNMFFALLAGVAASTNLTVDGSHSLAAGIHTFEVLHVTATGTLTINGVVEIIASIVKVPPVEEGYIKPYRFELLTFRQIVPPIGSRR